MGFLQAIIKYRFAVAAGIVVIILAVGLGLLHEYRRIARELAITRQNYAAAVDTLRVRYLRDSIKEYARESFVKELKDSLKIEAERSGQLRRLLSIAKAALEVKITDTIKIVNNVLDSTPGSCNVSWYYSRSGASWFNEIGGITTKDTTKITKFNLRFDLITGYRWNDKKHIEFFGRSDCPLVNVNNLQSCIVDISSAFPKPRLIPWWAHELIGAAAAAGMYYAVKKIDGK
jgi:hypothetical protein